VKWTDVALAAVAAVIVLNVLFVVLLAASRSGNESATRRSADFRSSSGPDDRGAEI
jgi:hypothetical protein